jgi:hypothetical protein
VPLLQVVTVIMGQQAALLWQPCLVAAATTALGRVWWQQNSRRLDQH